MEGLVILLGDFIAAALVPAIVLLIEAIVAAVSVIAELIGLLFSGALTKRAGHKPSVPKEFDRKPSSVEAKGTNSAQKVADESAVRKQDSAARIQPLDRWLRRIVSCSVLLFALTLIGAFLVNQFFFDPAVRIVWHQIESRTSIAVDFEKAEGSFWTGKLNLSDATIKREGHPHSNFDVKVKEMTFDIGMWNLLSSNPVFEQVAIRGAKGSYERLEIVERLEPRRNFHIDEFLLEDIELAIIDQTREPRVVNFALQVDSLATRDFDSRWAVFEILFRSDATGRIDNRPFLITSKQIDGGRETKWKADGLPIELVSPYLLGPFQWFDQGVVDINVDDRWNLSNDAPEIQMHWEMVFRDVKASVPGDLQGPTRIVAVAVVKFLNTHSERIPIRFDLSINKDEFESKASPEAAGLWKAVSDAAADAIGKATGMAKEKVQEAGKDAVDKFKDFLDRRRKEQEL